MNQTEYFKERKMVLEKEIAELEQEIALMPEGNLTIYTRKVGCKEYHSYYSRIASESGSLRTPIPKEKMHEARILANKKYNMRLLSDKKNELQCIDAFLAHRKDERFSELLDLSSPYRPLLIDNSSTPAQWEMEPYEKSKDHPEHLLIKAPKGELVRSKSEAMIAQALFSNKIAYRYENVHNINGVNIATDFTIMHPKTYEIKLWEHFGLCDKPSYQPTIDFKMHHYIRAGYLPGHNLILTFEDDAHPLSFVDVYEIVDKHFLKD